MISIVAGAALVSYMIYTGSSFASTSDERNEGRDPARALIHDRPLLLTVALWILTDIALLYR